jgi:tRNA pseudouridine38-40 synthase
LSKPQWSKKLLLRRLQLKKQFPRPQRPRQQLRLQLLKKPPAEAAAKAPAEETTGRSSGLVSSFQAMNQPAIPTDRRVDSLESQLSYHGGNFNGWAKQPGMRTVHAEFAKALVTIFGETETDFDMRVAGRTDAGVHALAQVLHFDIPVSRMKRIERGPDLLSRLNSLLPADIRVFSTEIAPEGFDARFSALFRRYRYRVSDHDRQRNPLEADYTLWHTGELDDLAMQVAALKLVGLHDFATFCRPRDFGTTIRELREVRVERTESGVIEIWLTADAFCHNMVRAIVGALMAVGQGLATAQEIAEVLAAESREDMFNSGTARAHVDENRVPRR